METTIVSRLLNLPRLVFDDKTVCSQDYADAASSINTSTQ